MKKIDMTNVDLIDTNVTSSKGNQQKWLLGGVWYKVDHMGYEGLAEVVVSRLLQKSNINNFVKYNPVKIQYKHSEKSGCYSENFRKKDEIILTFQHLYKAMKGESSTKALLRYHETEDKIKFAVDFIREITGLCDADKYLTAMLELDAFFLNEDRHTNNIAFIYNEKSEKYSFCPYFDFGLSLLSDMNDYPLSADMYNCIRSVKAKPFSDSFDNQIETANKLYGDVISFTFKNSDIETAVNEVKDYYSDKEINRVLNLLYNQKQKYSYMFK